MAGTHGFLGRHLAAPKVEKTREPRLFIELFSDMGHWLLKQKEQFHLVIMRPSVRRIRQPGELWGIG
jgi:hypothetical protein